MSIFNTYRGLLSVYYFTHHLVRSIHDYSRRQFFVPECSFTYSVSVSMDEEVERVIFQHLHIAEPYQELFELSLPYEDSSLIIVRIDYCSTLKFFSSKVQLFSRC